MKIRLVLIFCALLFSFFTLAQNTPGDSAGRNKTLIVFFDGLRPDYITAAQMPHLYAFRQNASIGNHHHSVFPTVTRVNSASYATGSYPGTHGILGNAIYLPEVDKNKSMGTTYMDLSKAMGMISGPLLTATTLGEVLEKAGERMMVFSSGTTGQAFLQNYKVSGGAIINPDLILPESFQLQVLSDIGEVSKDGEGENGRHKWVTDALLKYSLSKEAPLVSAVWFSDPDGAAHEHGIGSQEAVAAIKVVDSEFGRILEALDSRGMRSRYNIIISTDHGFVTQTGKQGLSVFLIQQGLKKDKESDDVVVAEGSVYVKDHKRDVIEQIVNLLQKQEWVGAIFTKAKAENDLKGWVEGTFAFEAAHLNHPSRTGDILVAPQWNSDKNDKGFAGSDFSKGVAGHGGSSPFEINIALTASGPDIKHRSTTEMPTSNVDIAPTILAIYGLTVPPAMDGRIISELLKKGGPFPGKLVKETLVSEVRTPRNLYRQTLSISVLGKYRYFNFSQVERK